MTAPKRQSDPVAFELVRNALEVLCEEMAATIVRAAYSPIIRHAHDLSTALLTPSGDVLAQGRTIPLHLGSVMPATKAVIAKFRRRMKPEDVFIVNDPYEGGSHLPDVFLITPIFIKDDVVAYVAAEAHHSDLGGRVPGSNAADSREIYEEGLRIPPSYLYQGGEPNETLFDLLEKNCRFPRQIMGDLGAQMAALRVGHEGFMKLVDRYGFDRLSAHIRDLFEYGEAMARSEIESWPEGVYEFTDWIDDDGLTDRPLPVRVKITVRADTLVIDYTGTADQVETAINTPATFVYAAAMTAFRCALGTDVPHNSGYMKPITLVIPEGTILNPRPPAAVAARVLSAYRAFDATIGCLAKIVPNRMMACGEGGNALLTFYGTDATGKKFILSDIQLGAWGGRHDREGIDGICCPTLSVSNVPVESIERETPLTIERYEFVPDSGGPGRFRGGMSVAREYRLGSGKGLVQVRSDRSRIPSYGLFGGNPGGLGHNVLNPGPNQRELESKHTTPLAAGDVFLSVLPGAGGWGNPLERDPQSVWSDVRNEKITLAAAARDYGTVGDPAGGPDLEGTRLLRERMMGRAGT